MTASRTATYARAAAAAAGVLGVAALLTRAQSRAAATRWPVVGRMVEVDGVELQVLERGQGRPLVLIHGNGAMIEDWLASGLFDSLAAQYRVIAFDRPGCGHSSRPRSGDWSVEGQAALLSAACRQLGIEQPVVLGHSLGTLVALAWALDFPDEVAALVLASGYYYPTARVDALLSGVPALPVIGEAMRHTISPLLGHIQAPLVFKLIFSPGEVPERFKQGYPTSLSLRPLQLRATAADGAAMVAAAARLSQRYDELALPVGIVAGTGDKLVDFETHSARLARDLPQASLHAAPRCGHMVHYQAHDSVLAAVDFASVGAPA